MPSTIEPIKALLQRCRRYEIDRCTLLVVPGCDWRPSELRQLRRWVEKGHELAGHGWSHRCCHIRSLAHRVHSCLLSRHAAEHLSLTPDEIVDLVSNCAEWFPKHDFERPTLYVPPAWALGAVPRPQLRQLPFELVETLTGITHISTGRRTRLPLVGFEADTKVRQVSLRGLNRFSQFAAACCRRPLRVAIHPSDYGLMLSRDLDSLLRQQPISVSYRVLI